MSRSTYRRINSPVSAVGATCSATYRTTPTGTDAQSDKKAPKNRTVPTCNPEPDPIVIATAHLHPPQVRVVQEEEPLQLSPAGLPDELATHRSLLIGRELHRHKINLEHYRYAPLDELRAAVVLTRSRAVGRLSTVTVAAITTTMRGIATEVELDESSGLHHVSVVKLDDVLTIPYERPGRHLGCLTEGQEAALHTALIRAFDLQ